MNTAAGTLAEILEKAGSSGERNLRLAEVVSMQLGLEGSDPSALVVQRLRALYFSCKKQIEALPYDQKNKNLALQHLDPIKGFENFTSFTQTLQNLGNSVLRTETYNGLRNLNMILMVATQPKPLETSLVKPTEQLRASIESISKLGIPDELKRIGLLRLRQVLEAAENYQLFGAEEIQSRVDALVGQVTVSENEFGAKARAHFRTAVAAAAAVAAAVVGADQTVQAYLSLEKNVPKLIEDLREQPKKEEAI